MSNKSTSPLDVAVGQAIRACRMVAGISQTELGQRVGVSFQQVQKYENGRNRVPSSRLAAIAAVLHVPVGALYPAGSGTKDVGPMEMLTDTHGAKIARVWPELELRHRRVVCALVVAITEELRLKRKAS